MTATDGFEPTCIKLHLHQGYRDQCRICRLKELAKREGRTMQAQRKTEPKVAP